MTMRCQLWSNRQTKTFVFDCGLENTPSKTNSWMIVQFSILIRIIIKFSPLIYALELNLSLTVCCQIDTLSAWNITQCFCRCKLLQRKLLTRYVWFRRCLTWEMTRLEFLWNFKCLENLWCVWAETFKPTCPRTIEMDIVNRLQLLNKQIELVSASGIFEPFITSAMVWF